MKIDHGTGVYVDAPSCNSRFGLEDDALKVTKLVTNGSSLAVGGEATRILKV